MIDTANLPTHTLDEIVDYETAREVMAMLGSALTSDIHAEESKSRPSAARLAALRAERAKIFGERLNLCAGDRAEVSRVISEYGMRVRQSFRTSDSPALARG